MDPGAGNLWTFNGGVWWHFIVRAAVVYFMVLVLLLLISNAVQNAMNGGDNSITAGALLAGTLIGADIVTSWFTRRSRKLEALVEGQIEILIHNGHVRDEALKKAGLTLHDLLAALRQHDCAGVAEVHTAILETNGRITVLTRKNR